MGKNDNKMAMTAAGLKLMIGGLLVMAAGLDRKSTRLNSSHDT